MAQPMPSGSDCFRIAGVGSLYFRHDVVWCDAMSFSCPLPQSPGKGCEHARALQFLSVSEAGSERSAESGMLKRSGSRGKPLKQTGEDMSWRDSILPPGRSWQLFGVGLCPSWWLPRQVFRYRFYRRRPDHSPSSVCRKRQWPCRQVGQHCLAVKDARQMCHEWHYAIKKGRPVRGGLISFEQTELFGLRFCVCSRSSSVCGRTGSVSSGVSSRSFSSGCFFSRCFFDLLASSQAQRAGEDECNSKFLHLGNPLDFYKTGQAPGSLPDGPAVALTSDSQIAWQCEFETSGEEGSRTLPICNQNGHSKPFSSH